jgi:hypothetical protein
MGPNGDVAGAELPQRVRGVEASEEASLLLAHEDVKEELDHLRSVAASRSS